MVVVHGDTEFGTIEFLNAVHSRSWRAVVGIRYTRKLQDGRSVKQLYRHGKRGQQIYSALGRPMVFANCFGLESSM